MKRKWTSKDKGSELMDTLLAAYRDQKAEYKITRNHIKALLAVNVYPLVACNNISLKIQIRLVNLVFFFSFVWIFFSDFK